MQVKLPHVTRISITTDVYQSSYMWKQLVLLDQACLFQKHVVHFNAKQYYFSVSLYLLIMCCLFHPCYSKSLHSIYFLLRTHTN